MSHDIDTTTGNAAVFVTGTPAWHGLGTVIDQAATSREAIKLAHLDWSVEQWPIQATEQDTTRVVEAPDRVANVRTDTHAVLGVVSRQYHVFQNAEAFDFMDAIVGDKLAMFETAGALNDGKRVWMLARIPKEYRAGPDDPIKPYVLLVNSHDGSTALRMIPTTVRVVCQNTLNLALGKSSRDEGITILHRASLDERVREARDRLSLIAARFDAFDQELHDMIARDMSTRELHDYFDGLVPAPSDEASERQKANRERVLHQLHANFEDPTNTLPGVRGTAWAAYNAANRAAAGKQVLANTALQLGRGLAREGRREHGLGTDIAGDDGLPERLGEPVGLAAAGARGNNRDLVHHPHPPPQIAW